MAANEEKKDPKEMKAEFVQSIKITKRQHFALLPKGPLGQIFFGDSRGEAFGKADAAKKASGGGNILCGTCMGGQNEKEFTLEKKQDDKKLKSLTTQVHEISKKVYGLTIKAAVMFKGQEEVEPAKK
jgi:hypothetical protein